MSLATETVRCPYCREPIHPKATRCKHCHAEIERPPEKSAFFTRLDTFRSGFIAGVIFCLILAVLAYFQFR
ncbi:MAG: hypothetical protein D6800_12605 [Candidatus Zixiibacteriota bacterium]|nr:MAG: hypothetical protein D6800_12605 [candidate division Zixibacteria bacterium]